MFKTNFDQNYLIEFLLTNNILKFQNHTVPFFRLASGIESPVYFDFKAISSFHEQNQNVMQALATKIKTTYPEVNFLLGVATGSIGIAAQLAQLLKVGYGYIRKKTKEYGTGSLIEGTISKNHKIVVIEDVITTGQSVWTAYDNARQLAQVNFLGIASLYNYDFKKSRALFKEHKVTTVSLLNLNSIIQYLKSDIKLNYNLIKTLTDFQTTHLI